MPASSQQSINLGLSAVPESTDPKLFQELVRIYNAIKILAQALDDYTGEGTVIAQLETIDTEAAGVADLAEFKKKYFKYTVPIFTVTGAFGTNGKVPQVSYALGAATVNVPAGGVGTAAGGWDTAANRDTAITRINAHSTAINNIMTALINNGIGV